MKNSLQVAKFSLPYNSGIKWLALGCMLLLFGGNIFAQEREYKEGFYPDGNIRYKGYFTGKMPIEVTHYYPTGGIKAVMTHQGDTTDATLYAGEEGYYTSGIYIYRKKEGEWGYYREGKLLIKEMYRDNKLNGPAYRYNRIGNVLEEKNWRNGQPDGGWKIFYENGHIRFETQYKEGKLNGELSSYTPDGKLSVKGQYKNDLKEGVWQYYTPDGELRKEIVYKNGIPENKEEVDLQENEEIERIEAEGRKIPDPANFIHEPDIYMKYTE